MLTRAIPLIGPPAVGKSALGIHLAQDRGYAVFRLREHVPQAVLAAAASATSAVRLGWVDDFTAMASVHGYVEQVIQGHTAHSILLDNFPGTETQVRLFLSLMRQLAPGCRVTAVELTAPEFVLRQRAGARRVCGYCERDPLCDPRLPATPSTDDPRRCARCRHLLGVHHGDDPSAYRARRRRYDELAEGIRQAFTRSGIPVRVLSSAGTPGGTAGQLTALFAHEESP